MAAPLQDTMAKGKQLKKLAKVSKNLLERENIRTTNSPSKVLCVQNGGIGNDVSQDEILPVFLHFGPVEGVIMIPKKQYCFVCLADVGCASRCLEELNGHVLRKGRDPSQDVVLYLFYVDEAPSNVLPSFELPPGLIIKEEFVNEDTERSMMKLMEENACKESERMKHRQVKHFGYEFKYDINDVDVTDPLPEGIPEICRPFLIKAIERGVVKHYPDQLTINMYRPGQGIPPHVDTREAFEDGIISLSLGSQVVMDFRHPDGRHLHVLVPRRSLLVMIGDSRYVWSHGITPRKSDIVTSSDGNGLTLKQRETRISFTFRKCVMDRAKRNLEIKESTAIGNPSRALPTNDKEAIALESEHVHKVYEDIADHFSGTRYKAWPRVVEFLMEQPPHGLLADVGCGNGKCLGHNSSLFEIGSDYSKNLASICHSRGFETCVADVTCLPFRSCFFDVVLCIAVIHHMATKNRRHQALCEVMRVLRPGGRALVYVWAMEQEMEDKKSKYLNKQKRKREEELAISSYTCVDADKCGKESDVTSGDVIAARGGLLFSPWLGGNENKADDGNREEREVAPPAVETENQSDKRGENQGDRYINIEVKRKAKISDTAQRDRLLDEDTPGDVCQSAGDQSLDSGNLGPPSNKPPCDKIELELEKLDLNSVSTETRGKTLHVHVNRTQFREQDMLVPWQLKGRPATPLKDGQESRRKGEDGERACSRVCQTAEDRKESRSSTQLFHRFYHVFRQGEIEAICKKVPDCLVRKSYYDQGNWCVVLEKV